MRIFWVLIDFLCWIKKKRSVLAHNSMAITWMQSLKMSESYPKSFYTLHYLPKLSFHNNWRPFPFNSTLNYPNKTARSAWHCFDSVFLFYFVVCACIYTEQVCGRTPENSTIPKDKTYKNNCDLFISHSKSVGLL